ncbi:polyphosphate kinase 2, PA0141 family [Chishuiella changwenlii]|jgi:polyphosphate kinase 2|uniref:ADP/GDP-polyphosphate phosphotransferase n=1 Tax=Chishuiella changwenlii TaxID=1434701 RepID=A0A1M7BKY7_9FLAO|nr:polyphosphate kinase 2 [Chishuiella changwenlii]GGF02724.1 polyphosphate kinase 2 [Chishuiella changwenlii]SHL55705.1 polyphosphate kinase 2, PA0141 family [Chishuiella changwenlii]
MAEFDLNDLEKISSRQEIIDFLVEHDIIKEKKFREQLAYEKELKELQEELLDLQLKVIKQNKRVLIIFEGRDAAGKGGTISRAIEYLNPKKYRVEALSKPTELEQGQWYFQRYFERLPNKGELVFFDRSWYNRAVVEPVFDFCTKEQYDKFMKQVVEVEKLLQEDGIIIVKLFLTISKEEQAQRLQERKEDELKQWKLGSLDEKAQELWDVYSDYIATMLEKTSTESSPWIEIVTDDKKEARIKALKAITAELSDQL